MQVHVTVANQCRAAVLSTQAELVGVGYVLRRLDEYVENLGVCQTNTSSPMMQEAKVAKTLTLLFSRVTVHLVVQMKLSRRKVHVVCCGQLTVRWTLDR